MTTDEVLKKLLREKEIYPPSVLDPHYSDTPEMTRGEIIEKTLREMGILLPSGEYAQSGDKAGHLSTVITELRRRLPDGNIKTCGAFKHLKAGCCAPCHTSRPHTDMNLIELPDGTKAWVCDSAFVEASSSASIRCEDDINCRPGWTKRRNPLAPLGVAISSPTESSF
jgi:hypothetical protein